MISTISKGVSKSAKYVYRSWRSCIRVIFCHKKEETNEEWWTSLKGVSARKDWPVNIIYFDEFQDIKNNRYPAMWCYYKSSSKIETFAISELQLAIDSANKAFPNRPIVISEFIGGVESSGKVPVDIMNIIKKTATIRRSSLKAEVAVE